MNADLENLFLLTVKLRVACGTDQSDCYSTNAHLYGYLLNLTGRTS
jgi:hypothetical protein